MDEVDGGHTHLLRQSVIPFPRAADNFGADSSRPMFVPLIPIPIKRIHSSSLPSLLLVTPDTQTLNSRLHVKRRREKVHTRQRQRHHYRLHYLLMSGCKIQIPIQRNGIKKTTVADSESTAAYSYHLSSNKMFSI